MKSLLKAASFFRDYRKVFSGRLLAKAVYVAHEIADSDFGTDDEKFAYAESLIKKNARAKFFVTSRINCASLCLALHTPLIYIEKVNQAETSYCRLGGLERVL